MTFPRGSRLLAAHLSNSPQSCAQSPAGVQRRGCGGRLNVLGPYTDADDARRDPLQQWKPVEQAHGPGRRHRSARCAARAARCGSAPAPAGAASRGSGTSRRCCTRARSKVDSVPFFSGFHRMLAAATASWMARLMPTPPTGDMACAASPMHSRPGRYQVRSRSMLTVSSLTSSHDFSSSTRSARNGSALATRLRGRPAVRPA